MRDWRTMIDLNEFVSFIDDNFGRYPVGFCCYQESVNKLDRCFWQDNRYHKKYLINICSNYLGLLWEIWGFSKNVIPPVKNFSNNASICFIINLIQHIISNSDRIRSSQCFNPELTFDGTIKDASVTTEYLVMVSGRFYYNSIFQLKNICGKSRKKCQRLQQY